MYTASQHVNTAAPGLMQSIAAMLGVGHCDPARPATVKVRRRDLCFILRNLAALVGNGLALPKALGTLARERSLKKYAGLLADLRRRVEVGESFSSALSQYSAVFGEVVVNQVRAAERAGTVAGALTRIADQLEKANRVRSQVIRRLSYPAVLVVAGAMAVTFMLGFVIPVFEEIYAESHVPLPGVTQTLIVAGHWTVNYGWIVPLVGLGLAAGIKQYRSSPTSAARMDGVMLRVPLLGDWLRNLAVLQFMDVFGDLLASGFKVVEALDISSRSVGNRAIRQSVEDLQTAVTRGERFGRELDQLGDLFPPVVSQLIAVGEQTGTMAKAASEIRKHLEKEIERQTNIMVGTIEPVLTVILAGSIAVILLAIYLPMFDMIGTVGRT